MLLAGGAVLKEGWRLNLWLLINADVGRFTTVADTLSFGQTTATVMHPAADCRN
jgi:hypothetical protein